MWPRQREQSSPVRPAAFGKLPWAGDFLQEGHPPGKEALLDWLERGISVGANRGNDWRQEFEEGVQKGFLFPASPDTVLAGVLTSSWDAVGRRFPFVVYTALDNEGILAAPHAAPLLLGPFLHGAGEEVLRLQGEPAELSAALARLEGPDLSSLTAHQDGYAAWTRGELIANAGAAIFGENWLDSFAYALYITWEAIRPFRGQESPPTPLSIRFPLGAGLAGAATFWIQVVRLCAGWRKTTPLCIWSFEPERPSLTVQLGAVSPQTFADVWQRAPDNEDLCDLMEPKSTGLAMLTTVRPDLATILRHPHATVEQLLSAFSPS